jgi:hypothetical protein
MTGPSCRAGWLVWPLAAAAVLTDLGLGAGKFWTKACPAIIT